MAEKPIKADVSIQDDKLYLYGTVGDYWDGITLDDVKRQARNMDKIHVTIHIHSYGGDATEGVAIRNFLMNTFDQIDVVIDGIAASSASIIATCGKTLSMPTGTTYMIHNPWTIAFGNRKDLLKEVGALESLETSYRNVYMERFTGAEDELIQLMEDETWLTADEASKLGFATQVVVDPEEDSKPVIESNLVATLLNKYAAKVEPDDNQDDTSIVDDDSKDNTAALDDEDTEIKIEPKPNNLLQNFAKVFSNFE